MANKIVEAAQTAIKTEGEVIQNLLIQTEGIPQEVIEAVDEGLKKIKDEVDLILLITHNQ
jgi:hypothetical protein